MSWLLCKTGKCFLIMVLILGSKGLYCVITRVITSGCGIAVENLSIFVEKCLYSEVLNVVCRVQDTSEMLTIIDNLNSSNSLTSDCKLVSFDIINMFPSIDNISGLKSVKKVLESSLINFVLVTVSLKPLNYV